MQTKIGNSEFLNTTSKILADIFSQFTDLGKSGEIQQALLFHSKIKLSAKTNCRHGRFPAEQPTSITGYDEQLVRRLIEKVTIYEDKFTVEFKSGMIVDITEYV